MTTTQYFRAFARFWWVIGLCVIVGVVLPIVVSSITKKYVSTTSVLVTGTPASQPTAAEASQVTLLAQQRMATYNDVATSTALAESMLEGLDTGLTAAQLTERTTSVVPENSTVLRISIEDAEADRAQLLAARAGDAMVAIIDRLEKEQAQSTTMLKGKVVADASAPSVSGTTAWRNPLLGGAAGLLVGLALAVAFSRLDPRLVDQDDVADRVGAPVLGLVPTSRRIGRFNGDSGRTSYDEAVREVRTGIFFLRKDNSCLTVAITSPSPVYGLGRITSSVAEALFETGARVLLVEADLDGTDAAETIQPDEASGVDVVSAGSAPGNAADPLHSQRFATLLKDAAERYAYVLVRAPATSLGTGAAAAAARCDVTVLAVKSDTRERQLREGLRHLKGVDANVRGVVLLT